VVQARPFSRLNERGQALIEYAAIVAVVGACLVAILGLVGKATHRAYDRTASAVSEGKSGFQGGGGGGGILTGTSSGVRPRPSAEPPPDSTASAEPPPDSEAGAGSAGPDATTASR
jgi:Flp pilus assembly pilin Flp